MACEGTYIGECCEQRTCFAEVILSVTLVGIQTPFDQVTDRCGAPENVFGVKRITTLNEYRNTRFDVDPESVCYGYKYWQSVRTFTSASLVCGPFSDVTVNEGANPSDCLSFFSPDIVDAIIERSVSPTYIYTRYRSRYSYEIEPDILSVDRVVVEELDAPLAVADWIAAAVSAAEVAMEQGFRLRLTGNCTGEFTTSREAIGDAPLDVQSTLQSGPGAVTLNLHYSKANMTRPYCIRDAPVSGCTGTTIFHNFPKLLAPEIPEIDCVDLRPGLNRRLTYLAGECPA